MLTGLAKFEWYTVGGGQFGWYRRMRSLVNFFFCEKSLKLHDFHLYSYLFRHMAHTVMVASLLI